MCPVLACIYNVFLEWIECLINFIIYWCFLLVNSLFFLLFHIFYLLFSTVLLLGSFKDVWLLFKICWYHHLEPLYLYNVFIDTFWLMRPTAKGNEYSNTFLWFSDWLIGCKLLLCVCILSIYLHVVMLSRYLMKVRQTETLHSAERTPATRPNRPL